jgi:hypothetical protein
MANDINQFLVTESGRIMYDIYMREQHSSPWISQPRKVAWPEGMGETIDNIMWERPYIAGSGNASGDEGPMNDWGAMSFNNGQSDGGIGGSCIPPVDDVRFSQTLRRTSLFQKAVHSPRFCVTDLLYTAKREAQMKAVEWGLGDMVRLYWINWNRDGFTRWSKKYIIEGSLQTYNDETDGMVFPPVAATSQLTNGILDYFTNLLTLEKGARHALSFQNGKPVYGLITDQLTSRKLQRADDKIREDFRYGKPDSLLMPLGVSHTYNSYIHMMDDMPNRYNFNGELASDAASDWLGSDGLLGPLGEADSAYTDPWVLVQPYTLIAQGDGTYRKEINPEWLAAEFQDSYIYVKEAYQLRVPGSVTSVSKAKFDPQSYMGDFKWQNVVNLDETSPAYNPDGKLGRFRGVMSAGVEPINPHVMFTLRHKVCPIDFGFLDCVD